MFQDIILVEDDEDDRMLFIDALHNIGQDIPIKVAVNGAELMTMLNGRDKIPEIIFLDLNMPIKNGFQCLREIAADSKFRSCKVVVLTTSQNPADISLAYSLGATLFVTKPIDFLELQSTLENILNSDNPASLNTYETA